MKEVKFDHHHVSSRKDLLHFVEEHEGSGIYREIGKRPNAWVEELNIVSQILTRESLVAGIDIFEPPISDPDFVELGKGVFLYRGKEPRLRGLWTSKPIKKDLREFVEKELEWTHYRMGTAAELMINQEFAQVPFEQFLPENFEQIAKPVESIKGHNKRPISTFAIKVDGKEVVVYAKGADVSPRLWFSHAKPMYRLTHIMDVSKTTSKTEMERTLKLGNLGINVPRIVGYYDSPVEEFLFLEEVKGKHPNEFLPEHREQIIFQDAAMLADLCIAGYMKHGFTDFDDKVFDGRRLHLIDVDECIDVYFPARPDFREMLLDPRDLDKLKKFRRLQRDIFTTTMRDAIFDYRETLTPAKQDQAQYVNAFFQRMRWKKPSDSLTRRLTTFSKNYTTADRYMAMMCEE
ncbi:MAG: hypothetical protein WC796_01475 [Candidatus Pacearchaeota archaeon]|jgi:hypothetical protein